MKYKYTIKIKNRWSSQQHILKNCTIYIEGWTRIRGLYVRKKKWGTLCWRMNNSDQSESCYFPRITVQETGTPRIFLANQKADIIDQSQVGKTRPQQGPKSGWYKRRKRPESWSKFSLILEEEGRRSWGAEHAPDLSPRRDRKALGSGRRHRDETLWPKYLRAFHCPKYLEETSEDANIAGWNQINI